MRKPAVTHRRLSRRNESAWGSPRMSAKAVGMRSLTNRTGREREDGHKQVGTIWPRETLSGVGQQPEPGKNQNPKLKPPPRSTRAAILVPRVGGWVGWMLELTAQLSYPTTPSSRSGGEGTPLTR